MFSTDILETDSSASQIKSYYSSRTEALLGILLGKLDDDQNWRKDPFSTAHIIVPNSGMQRYLELKISQHFGVFAQVHIAFPSQYLRQCYEQVLGNIALPAHWDSRALTFAILAQWKKSTHPESAVLTQLLKDHHTPRQRYGLATQIAKLFSSYLNERPEIVTAWDNQQMAYAGKQPHEQWQMALFNTLQLGQFSREKLQQQFHQALSQRPTHSSPVHIFGFHALPPLQLADFSVLSQHTDVFTYVFNPSVTYWQDIVPQAIKSRHEIEQADEETLMTVGNPLLASWGQAGKYLIEQLNNQKESPLAIDETLHFNNDSVLSWLQNNIRQLVGETLDETTVSPKLAQQVQKATENKQYSLSLHVAASPRREVEILYDHICHLFSDNRHPEQVSARLNPADILVMVPNLRDYAPHIQAVFGNSQSSIPFSLANQKAGSADTQVQAFLALINMIDSDFQSQALFDAISETHVRQYFNLSLNDLETLRYWLIKSRFAQHFYDDSQGATSSLEKLLDSLLLAAIGGETCQITFDGTPRQAFFAYQEGQRETLNAFCSIISALLPLTRLRQQSYTLDQWREQFHRLANRFLGEDSRLHQRITQWYESLTEELHGDTVNPTRVSETPFDYETVRTDLVNLLENEDLHGPFLSGGVSFCAMVPMRSIPAKMICLLGLNHHFPAIDTKNPLDLRQFRPLWSDKKANKEHKYFFLETLMAARETLYLSYVGQDEKTGEYLPPSILVDELWATISQAFPQYAIAAKHTYPIQGYLSDSKQITYQSLYTPYQPDQAPTEQSNPVETTLPTQLKANELVSALLEPFVFYLKKHLHSSPISTEEESLFIHDFIAKENGLDGWQYNQAVLMQSLFETDSISELKHKNYYAPEPVSQALLAQHQHKITPLIHALSPLAEQGFSPLTQFISHASDSQTFHLMLDVPYYNEQGIWLYRFGAVDAKYYLRSWVNHVLLNLLPNQPSYETQLFTLNKGQLQHDIFQPLTRQTAQKALDNLLALYRECFANPYALELNYVFPTAKKSHTETPWQYQPKDYSLYPALMRQSQSAGQPVLLDLLATMNKHFHQSQQGDC